MQHMYTIQHSTVTALHTLINTVTKGFNQMAPPARTITVALDISKAFDTINIHTLIRKLLQTNIPSTIMKFIAKPTQHIETTHPDNVNLKLAFHKMASFHPHYLTFTLQTYHHPFHRFRSCPTLMTSPSNPHTQARVQPINIIIQPYLHKVFAWTKQNNLILNLDKTTFTLFTPMHYPWQRTRMFWVLP